MLFRSVALLAITALVLPPAAHSRPAGQNKSAVDQWIQQSYEATQRYRSGDLTGALQLLGSMTKDEQEKAVGAIRVQIERIAAGWPPKTDRCRPLDTAAPSRARRTPHGSGDRGAEARRIEMRTMPQTTISPSQRMPFGARHCPDGRAGSLRGAVDPGDRPRADGASRVHGRVPHPHAALSTTSRRMPLC